MEAGDGLEEDFEVGFIVSVRQSRHGDCQTDTFPFTKPLAYYSKNSD
ncbi:hypothetical protein [Aquiflexum lacus]|nr:hypothetical protein [Aquiflexum lacus]